MDRQGGVPHDKFKSQILWSWSVLPSQDRGMFTRPASLRALCKRRMEVNGFAFKSQPAMMAHAYNSST